MPNSYRIRTTVGEDTILPIKLDQEFDSLEILSLSIFPNDVYTRSCADFGVICGRVFANRGLGLQNARVSVFIPIQPEDEENPIISTLYPYKSFADFNEDGYKYNLLPYVQSYSGHVPVGTFPDRIDALINPSVVEVYDKYYKFTAKTNDAGDFMIFGVPVGQHELFMQVDLSDIGEFSLTPQDLIRMGRATESQVNGTKFRFSENYSELPQIITLTKTIQVAPFYGEKDICDYYIVRADFDLTSEAAIEFKPTAVFMGSLISANNRKKIKRNCKVPAKQGWMCELIAGPGQIETVRQTIFTDDTGRPVLEEFRLENDGKLIDENGAWMIELPMNIDYEYTDENGNRRISYDGSVGVPTKGKYRFKVKWQQSTSLREENRRGYFLVPNVKEYGWSVSTKDSDDPALSNLAPSPDINLPTGTNIINISPSSTIYYSIYNTQNVSSYVVLVDGVERSEYQTIIPMPELAGQLVQISYSLIDEGSGPGKLKNNRLTPAQFQLQSSYAFSLNWIDYGTPTMIQEAIDCEDRFYEFKYNKVYTISQFLDRYTGGIFPGKTIQIKHITDNACEGSYNPFPTNDVFYRFDVTFIILSIIIGLLKYIFIPLTIMLHVLATVWLIFIPILALIGAILNFIIIPICKGVNALSSLFGLSLNCPSPINIEELTRNPFKNIGIPLILNTEEGCQVCRCKQETLPIDAGEDAQAIANALNNAINQISENNTSALANFPSRTNYTNIITTENVFGNGVRYTATTSNDSVRHARLLTLLAGSRANYQNGDINLSQHWIRLPFFTNTQDAYASDVAGGMDINTFSLDLTIAERLNLFNTKAKYFDNMTPQSGINNPVPAQSTATNINLGNSTPYGVDEASQTFLITPFFDTLTSDASQITIFRQQYGNAIGSSANSSNGNSNQTIRRYGFDNIKTFSPGNTGWNQVKVSWGIDFTANEYTNPSVDYNTYGQYKSHFDNLLVMVMDANSTFVAGDLITFQNPEDSEDANVNTTIGTYTYPVNVTVGYANPDFSSGNNRLNRTYKIRNGQFVTTGTTCYPSDIEYFQVIKVFSYRDYLNGSSLNLGGPGGPANPNNEESGKIKADYRFSLPFRFMRTNHGDFKTWGQPGTEYSVLKDSNSVIPDFTNSQNIYTFYHKKLDADGTELYSEKCRINTTTLGYFPSFFYGYNNAGSGTMNNIDSWKSYDNSDNLKVVFVQRGVDPNSPKIKMRFDLRRYFGSKTPWGQNPRKQAVPDGQNPETTGPTLNPQYWLVEGFYRMNIPIQPGGEVNGGAWETLNPKGLQLPYHNQVLNNEPNPSTTWSNIFFKSYVFSYNAPVDNDFDGTWKTKMPLYYSALDKYTKFVAQSWLKFENYTDIYPDLAASNALNLDVVIPNSTYEGVVTTDLDNGFGKRLMVEHARNKFTESGDGQNGKYNGSFKQPCSLSIGSIEGGGISPSINIPDNLGAAACADSEIPGSPNTYLDQASNGLDSAIPQALCCAGGQSYSINSDIFGGSGLFGGGDTEFGNAEENYLSSTYRYHKLIPNYLCNNVGGYWGNEYVEGGSFFSVSLKTAQGPLRRDLDCSYAAEQCMSAYVLGDPDCPVGAGVLLNSNRAVVFSKIDLNLGRVNFTSNNRGLYVTPVYAAFRDDTTPTAGYTQDTWYVKPNHEITMSNPERIVFRTDRLPSSDYLQKDDNGGAFVMQQNSGFRIYKLVDCEVIAAGGGEVTLEYPTDSNITDLLPGDGAFNEVAESLVSCAKAVDLNSYSVEPDGTPFIHDQGPYSKEGKYLWFRRGVGCYNLVSRPLTSLFRYEIPPTGEDPLKIYNDIRSIVEWVQRTKLTLAQCFDIFSHTFSNNWINGTLYAFPFQSATFFDSNNQPYREYCENVVYLHQPLKNFFYRSSPWNGTNFIGKAKYDLTDNTDDAPNRYGNTKNLLFPTTILDMGPKNQFIQEIVFNDDYDGYVVNRVPTSSFQDITTSQNLFILSRLVNAKFIQLLFPTSQVDDDGNESGSDDPSIKAFFQNRRWQSSVANPQGEIFFGGFLPGQVDGDYSQMISINSQMGVLEFSPENYGADSIYFGLEDDGGYPYYGLFFNADNKIRDYVSPRRTLYDENQILPITDINSTSISVNTQVVPFYQWNINQTQGGPDDTIFANQNNNFTTLISPSTYFDYRYQQLDRTNNASQYFKPDGANSFNYKGYIYNINLVTNVVNPLSPSGGQPARFTVGAPFYFYFGLIQGASAMDKFITKYVDTNITIDE